MTDTSDKSGEHWRMLWFDLINGKIYFVDSVGNSPEPFVTEFINKIIHYFTLKNIQYEYKINTKQFQTGSSECGVFSIFFTIQFLTGKSFDSLMNCNITDEEVNKCRNVYFSNK